MKYSMFLLQISILILAASLSTLALNRIEGRVYDPDRAPVGDADVELLNDVGSLLIHSRTDATGRFYFSGVSTGRFKVRVLALRLNLLPQTQDVEVVSISQMGNAIEYVDFYLVYDKRAADRQPLSPVDAIFVQDIPSPAKSLYKKALNDFEKEPDKAFGELEEAVKIFPTYFDALSKLGIEYINRKQYEKGYPYLLQAIDINQRSSASFYSLAYAFLQLKQIPAALQAAKATVIINPDSVSSLLLYGTILRQNGNYEPAEKNLLKAKSLSKMPVLEIYWQLALLYNKLNRNQNAIDELETYLKLVPETPDKKMLLDLITKLKNAK